MIAQNSAQMVHGDPRSLHMTAQADADGIVKFRKPNLTSTPLGLTRFVTLNRRDVYTVFYEYRFPWTGPACHPSTISMYRNDAGTDCWLRAQRLVWPCPLFAVLVARLSNPLNILASESARCSPSEPSHSSSRSSTANGSDRSRHCSSTPTSGSTSQQQSPTHMNGW